MKTPKFLCSFSFSTHVRLVVVHIVLGVVVLVDLDVLVLLHDPLLGGRRTAGRCERFAVEALLPVLGRCFGGQDWSPWSGERVV